MWGFIVRSLVAVVGAMALLIALGSVHSAGLAVSAGFVGAGGLGWAIAFSRIRRGPFALPPLLSVLGVAAFALAFVAAARPTVLYMPQWIVSHRVAHLHGDRVLGDAGKIATAAVIQAHPRYRRAFADLLGVDAVKGMEACDVDVIVPNQHDYDTLARAAGLDLEGAAMGFAFAPPLGRRVVVHRPDSGWGSITHHMALHVVACEMPRAPPWIANGVAALVEKHTLDEHDRFVVNYLSDWREPDKTLRSPVRDLNVELFRGDDQGFLRSLFLYLNERNQLRPLLQRVRAGEDAVQALAAVTGKGPHALEADWHAWLGGQARALHLLEAATPDVSAPPI